MSDSDHESLVDLPPSAKLVYVVLKYKGPLTQKALAEESLLPPRTVRYAVKRLEEVEAVTDGIYIPDARQNLYEICPENVGHRDTVDADTSTADD